MSPETGENKVRTLHRNLLHLVNDLPVDLPLQSQKSLTGKKRGSTRHLPTPSIEPQRQQRARNSQSTTKEQSESGSDSSDDEEAHYWLKIPVRRGLESTQVQPVHEPQKNSNQVTTTERPEQTRPLIPGRETRRSVHVSEKRGNMPVAESRGTRHRTQDQDEWTEEEQLPVDPIPAECEQEDMMMQEDRPVASQTISEQPYDDQASQPQIRRSTRERKPTQMFTYESLGQPSFQPQAVCNTVGAYVPPLMPIWEMQARTMTYHTPFKMLPHPTLY